MKSLYIIRDKNTGAVCSSAKHRYFTTDTNEASLFDSQKNAEKAIRAIVSSLTKAVNPYGGNKWHLTTAGKNAKQESFFYAFKKEYIELLQSKAHLQYAVPGNEEIPEAQFDLEVVEVKLTIVG